MNNNDLISRSALLELAHNHVGGTVDCNDIARFPAVDAEVVRHGLWESCFEDWRQQIEGNKCSACGFEYYGSHYNYCPNCGAKMRGDDGASE